MRCAIEGTRAVQIAISAGTLTSIIVFLPNLFGATNMISIYLSQVAMHHHHRTAGSWLVAVSLIPMISARLPTPPAVTTAHGFIPGLTRRYGGLLRWSLEHRGKSLIAILLIVGISLVPASQVKMDMFGEEPGLEMGMYLKWKGAYSLEQMSDEVAKLEKHLEANRKRYHIRQIYVFYAEQGWASIRLDLNAGEGVDPKAVQEMLRKELPKLARAEVGFQGSNDSGDNGLEVQFYLTGDSSEELVALGEGLLPLLASRKELRDVRVDSGDENSEVQVTVNRERAAAYGFSAQEVAQYISIALRGAPLREFRSGDTEVPVNLRFDGSEQFRMQDMSNLTLRRADGSTVPLMAVVDVNVRRGSSQIGRQNRQTGLSIKATIAGEATKEDARKAVEETMAAAKFKPGYSWAWGQNQRNDDEAGAQMGINMLIALVMILRGDGGDLRVAGVPDRDPVQHPVLVPGRVLAVLLHRHHLLHHGDDRHAGADGRGGEQRHRHGRAHQHAAPAGHAAHRGAGGRQQGAPAPDPDDHGDDDPGHAAAVFRRRADRRRRPALPPDGACRGRWPGVLDDRQPAVPADHLHHARRRHAQPAAHHPYGA